MQTRTTKLSEEEVGIRAVGEENNEKVRAQYVFEARERKIKKIKKWLLVGLAIIVVVMLLLWVVF